MMNNPIAVFLYKKIRSWGRLFGYSEHIKYSTDTLRQMNLLLPDAAVFPKTGTNVTLESVNALWVDKKLPIFGKFQTNVQEKYGEEIVFHHYGL